MSRLLSVSLILAFSSSSSAWAFEVAANQWPAGTDTLVLQAPLSMPSDHPNRWATLVEAADIISSTAADFNLLVIPLTLSHGIGNGVSEVFFTRSAAILCGSGTCSIAFMDPTASGGVR